MSNQIVIDGLRVKLAEIAGTIGATEHRLKTLSRDKATITAALRLFDDPGVENPTLGIPHGSFNRTILETLRDADEALSARGIAERMAKGKALDTRQMGLLVARVRNAMPRLSDRLEGEQRDRATFWRVKLASA
jgi:hypothetical protein